MSPNLPVAAFGMNFNAVFSLTIISLVTVRLLHYLFIFQAL